jgi:hypothetical protein
VLLHFRFQSSGGDLCTIPHQSRQLTHKLCSVFLYIV